MSTDLKGARGALKYARACLATAHEAKRHATDDIEALVQALRTGREQRVAASRARAAGEAAPDAPSLEEIDDLETQIAWNEVNADRSQEAVERAERAVVQAERAVDAATDEARLTNLNHHHEAFMRCLNELRAPASNYMAASMIARGSFGQAAEIIAAISRLDLKLDWPDNVRPEWLPRAGRTIDEPIHGLRDLTAQMRQEIEA